MEKESMKQLSYTYSVDIRCLFHVFLSTAFIIGFFSPCSTELNFTYSRVDIHMANRLFTHCLDYGLCSNFATISVMLFCLVSEKRRQKLTHMRTLLRREEFHLDGDLTLYLVRTISGKRWAG